MKQANKKLISVITPNYFILLAAINLIADTIMVGFKWIDLIMLVLCCIPAFVRKKITFLMFGLFSTALWGWLMLAVISDHIDYAHGKHINHPVSYFSMGYLLTIVSTICSLCFIYSGMTGQKTVKPLQEATN